MLLVKVENGGVGHQLGDVGALLSVDGALVHLPATCNQHDQQQPKKK